MKSALPFSTISKKSTKVSGSTLKSASNIPIRSPEEFSIASITAGPFPVVFNNSLSASWGFSKIIFDQKDSLYKTHIYECDTGIVNIYLATSKSSVDWKIKHLLSPEDFNNVTWNVPEKDGKMKVTPLVSDIIKHNEKFYSYAYGDDSQKKTYIGLLTSDSLDGEYTISKKPLLSPNPSSKFSNNDVYHPKVIKTDSSWIMFYTAKNDNNEEFICAAKSIDLINWSVIKENIIPRNNGWNSALYNQLCSQVKIKNDTLFLWATGAKEVGDYNNPNKGNPMDLCIGKFYTLLPILNFKECPGNPIFGGNPIFEFENDHIGASFQEIEIDDYITTYYHGKGTSGKNYTILIK